jgi:hypothetical protein
MDALQHVLKKQDLLVQENPQYVHGLVEMVLSLVKRNAMITLMMELVVKQDVKAGRLVIHVPQQVLQFVQLVPPHVQHLLGFLLEEDRDQDRIIIMMMTMMTKMKKSLYAEMERLLGRKNVKMVIKSKTMDAQTNANFLKVMQLEGLELVLLISILHFKELDYCSESLILQVCSFSSISIKFL